MPNSMTKKTVALFFDEGREDEGALVVFAGYDVDVLISIIIGYIAVCVCYNRYNT